MTQPWLVPHSAPRLRRVSLWRDSIDAVVGRLVNDGQVDPVWAGRLLVLAQAVLMTATAPLLHPTPAGWLTLGLLDASTVLLVAGTFVVGSVRAPLIFPISTVAAVAVLGIVDPGTFAPAAGYLTLSFVWIGVTRPARDAVLIMPLAAVAIVLCYGGLTGPVLVRLVVTTTAWLTTAGLLAWVSRRHVATASELRGAAHVDELTGMPNRRDLEQRLTLTTSADTIVVCDLDHFKAVNDTLGHAAGDSVLREFGALLRAELRSDDYGARLGGEEFVIIISGTDRTGHQPLIDRLHEHWALLQPTITFSTGSAACSTHRDARATLALADQALYVAKNAGRNTDRSHAQSFLDRAAPAGAVPRNVAYRIVMG